MTSSKNKNVFTGLLLFSISIVLIVVTGTLGFIYGVFHSLFSKGLMGISTYLTRIAISIDQLGNVIMKELLNVLWLKKDGYKFGNRDETISSVLGKNKLKKKLSKFGVLIDKILDFIDAQHSLNSIDYYVEPNE